MPKRPSFETLVAKILDEKVPGADMRKREALARVFVDSMLKRDGRMISEFLAREWPATHNVAVSSLPDPPQLDESPSSLEATARILRDNSLLTMKTEGEA